MKSYSIGVFDSGLGGLTAVKELMHVLPNENIIYFGDTGRVPYGNRSKSTIKKYALQDANFLLRHNVKGIVAACGTVSSVAGDLSQHLNVPYTGVVAPTCYTAVEKTKNNKIGVIGTSATINSHSYKKELTRRNPDLQIFEQDCPLFVPLVENGFIDKDDPVARLVIEKYLKNFMDANVDTIILGCTHYPILSEAISAVVGDSVTLIDSGKETAIYTRKILAKNDLLNKSDTPGECKFYVSDTPDNFEKIASLFLGKNIQHTVSQIDIEQY